MMDILFDKDGKGSVELRNATGSYYANNQFEKIRTDVILATDEMTRLVGRDLMARALAHYASSNFQVPEPNASQLLNDQLVYHLQFPIAYRATFRYYQTNLVGHEDSGRKVKIDNENEKMPWEWMLDRDDSAQVRKANETTDRLIRWLDENEIAEWMDSDNRKAVRSLFVNTAEIFHDTYPIDLSSRFFYTIVSFLREVQERKIKKALGEFYDPLLAHWQGSEENQHGSDIEIFAGSLIGQSLDGIFSEDGEGDQFISDLLGLVQRVIPLYAMVLAVKRLNLQVMPDGVVQHFKSMVTSRGASQPALPELVNAHVKNLEKDANYMLDDIKILIQSMDPEAGKFLLQPNNDEGRKYFRT